ncbi:MAG TPA: alpha/beta fold hydrolase [Xanthobacteraceae bacterium]|nr:alpha/beta fold hydrolase [Xanthobacteraceae bacterium]
MPVQESVHRTRDIKVRSFRQNSNQGNGSTVLFLHGAGGFPGWLPFFDQLAAKHDVLVLEHPGFGESDNPDWIRNVADVAMYYLDVLAGLNAGKVHLVGHSLGGWIAAEAATRNCQHLASLTLIAPAGIRVKGVPAGDNFIWSPEETARNLYHDQAFADRMLAQQPTEKETEILMRNRFMAAKLGWEPRWFNPALERWLHRIAVPSLVIWGEDDKLLPSRYAAVWGERVPNVTVKVIPQCGHLPHVERAGITADAVLAFLGGR